MKKLIIVAAMLLVTSVGATARELTDGDKEIIVAAFKKEMKVTSSQFKWVPISPKYTDDLDYANYCVMAKKGKNSQWEPYGVFLIWDMKTGKLSTAGVTDKPMRDSPQFMSKVCADFGYPDLAIAK